MAIASVLPPAARAQLSGAEAGCVLDVTKSGIKVSTAQAKLQDGCVKSSSRDASVSADTCSASDASGKVGKARDKTVAVEAASCTAGSGFVPIAASGVNDAGRDETEALMKDLLGDPADAAVSTDPALAACQLKVQKQLHKVLAAKLKAYSSCLKTAVATATDRVPLGDCLLAVASNEKVLAAVAKLSDVRSAACSQGTLAGLFPGNCASETPEAAFDLCLDAVAECRVCRMLVAMNGLDVDCDSFDNGAIDLSCGVCGDGVIQSGEDCDDGNELGSDCCSNDCKALPPPAETCNDIDDDCDGSVDEDNPEGGSACTSSNVGICAAGSFFCSSGSLSCVSNISPGSRTETCNGADDDCDGATDEGNPGGGGACSSGLAGICDAGTLQCSSGSLSCVPGTTPGTVSENCNGADDDCDGSADEENPGGGGACSSGLAGICDAGTLQCSSGSLSCVPDTTPGSVSETCNDTDDDCDGDTDEDCAIPANDLFADALPIALGSAETVVTGSTIRAARDGAAVSCGCSSSGNVWYRFTLADRSYVYFDTAGSGWNTSLWITDASGNLIGGQGANGRPDAGLCNDDGGCASGSNDWTSAGESRTWGLLNAGSYAVSVSGCRRGEFTLRGQAVVATNATAAFLYLNRLAPGTGTTTTNLASTSVTQGSCGGADSGEDMRWFTSCGSPQSFSLCQSDGGSFERQNGSALYDPTLYMRSAKTGAQITCNDDGPSALNCTGTGGDTRNYGSRISAVAVPRGITTVFVDSRTGGSGMDYKLAYTVQD